MGTILTALLIAALVAGIIWFFQRRRSTPNPSVTSATDDPLRLAASRYAAGQIDRAQFEQIRSDLHAMTTAAENRSTTEAGGEPRPGH